MDRHDLVWNPWHGYGCRICLLYRQSEEHKIRNRTGTGEEKAGHHS